MLAALSVSNSNIRLIYSKKDPESDINMMYIFDFTQFSSVTATTAGAGSIARSRTLTSASTGRAPCSRTAPTPWAPSTARVDPDTRGTASSADRK